MANPSTKRKRRREVEKAITSLDEDEEEKDSSTINEEGENKEAVEPSKRPRLAIETKTEAKEESEGEGEAPLPSPVYQPTTPTYSENSPIYDPRDFVQTEPLQVETSDLKIRTIPGPIVHESDFLGFFKDKKNDKPIHVDTDSATLDVLLEYDKPNTMAMLMDAQLKLLGNTLSEKKHHFSPPLTLFVLLYHCNYLGFKKTKSIIMDAIQRCVRYFVTFYPMATKFDVLQFFRFSHKLLNKESIYFLMDEQVLGFSETKKLFKSVFKDKGSTFKGIVEQLIKDDKWTFSFEPSYYALAKEEPLKQQASSSFFIHCANHLAMMGFPGNKKMEESDADEMARYFCPIQRMPEKFPFMSSKVPYYLSIAFSDPTEETPQTIFSLGDVGTFTQTIGYVLTESKNKTAASRTVSRFTWTDANYPGFSFNAQLKFFDSDMIEHTYQEGDSKTSTLKRSLFFSVSDTYYSGNKAVLTITDANSQKVRINGPIDGSVNPHPFATQDDDDSNLPSDYQHHPIQSHPYRFHYVIQTSADEEHQVEHVYALPVPLNVLSADKIPSIHNNSKLNMAAYGLDLYIASQADGMIYRFHIPTHKLVAVYQFQANPEIAGLVVKNNDLYVAGHMLRDHSDESSFGAIYAGIAHYKLPSLSSIDKKDSILLKHHKIYKIPYSDQQLYAQWTAVGKPEWEEKFKEKKKSRESASIEGLCLIEEKEAVYIATYHKGTQSLILIDLDSGRVIERSMVTSLVFDKTGRYGWMIPPPSTAEDVYMFPPVPDRAMVTYHHGELYLLRTEYNRMEILKLFL